DAALRDAVGLRQREQVIKGRTACVDRACLQQRAHLVQRRGMIAVVTPVYRGGALGWRVETKEKAHRRRLAGSVRAEETGDHSRSHHEREPVDRPLATVIL